MTESIGVHPTQNRYQAVSGVQPVDSLKYIGLVLLVQGEGGVKILVVGQYVPINSMTMFWAQSPILPFLEHLMTSQEDIGMSSSSNRR